MKNWQTKTQIQEKIEKSKERILECLKVGTWLNAKVVVFHPGFYGKCGKEETYENKTGNSEVRTIEDRIVTDNNEVLISSNPLTTI